MSNPTREISLEISSGVSSIQIISRYKPPFGSISELENVNLKSHLRLRLNGSELLWLASSWVFTLESVLSKPMHSQFRYEGSGSGPAVADILFSAVASHSFPRGGGARWHLV